MLTACLWSAYPKGTIEWQSTYLKRTILSSQFLGLNQGNWAKCMTFDSPISKEPYTSGWCSTRCSFILLSCSSRTFKSAVRTIISSQFLGLKQGYNWAKCVTVNPPISKEPYYQVNFLGWSRAIGQNVWLSIHLSQQNHIIKSISWVEAGQLGKMCDYQSTFLKKKQIIKSISWVEAG